MGYTDLLILLMQSIADSCNGPCFEIPTPSAPQQEEVKVEQVNPPEVIRPTKPCMATQYGKQVPCAEIEKDNEQLLKRMEKFNEEMKK